MTFDVFSPAGALLCAVFFFAGIIDAVCGGGGLLTIPMFMAVGFPTHLIMGTNQSSIVLGGVTSFARFWKNGAIHWKSVLPVIPVAVVGSFLGSRLNLLLPDQTLKLVMVILLPVAVASTLIRHKDRESCDADTLPAGKVFLNAVIIGLAVGTYQGFYGAGAGTFYMLAFAALDRMDLKTASGNTKVVSLCSTLTAGLSYAVSGAVVWPMVIAASVFNIAGSYLGSGLAIRRGTKVIRPMMYAMLAVLFVRILYTMLTASA